MQMGAGAAAGSALLTTPAFGLAHGVAKGPARLDLDSGQNSIRASINNAYLFLDQMMDAYVQGSAARLVESYSDQIAGGTFFSTAFIYDNALIMLAYLARGKGDDIARAKIVGDAILFARTRIR